MRPYIKNRLLRNGICMQIKETHRIIERVKNGIWSLHEAVWLVLENWRIGLIVWWLPQQQLRFCKCIFVGKDHWRGFLGKWEKWKSVIACYHVQLSVHLCCWLGTGTSHQLYSEALDARTIMMRCWQLTCMFFAIKYGNVPVF